MTSMGLVADSVEEVLKGWDERAHPRGKNGRWIKLGAAALGTIQIGLHENEQFEGPVDPQDTVAVENAAKTTETKQKVQNAVSQARSGDRTGRIFADKHDIAVMQEGYEQGMRGSLDDEGRNDDTARLLREAAASLEKKPSPSKPEPEPGPSKEQERVANSAVRRLRKPGSEGRVYFKDGTYAEQGDFGYRITGPDGVERRYVPEGHRLSDAQVRRKLVEYGRQKYGGVVAPKRKRRSPEDRVRRKLAAGEVALTAKDRREALAVGREAARELSTHDIMDVQRAIEEVVDVALAKYPESADIPMTDVTDYAYQLAAFAAPHIARQM